MYDNYQFLSDPVGYLQRQPVSCYLQQGSIYTKDISAAGANNATTSVPQTFAFDLVDGKMPGIKEFRIVGNGANPGPQNPYNPKIIGNWIPYLGQPTSSDFNAFGFINLTDVLVDYVFTYHMNGCNLVVVNGNDGHKYVYHEPTTAKWKTQADYSSKGNVIYRTSPNYDHPENLVGIGTGFVLMRRWFGVWFVIVQTIDGTGRVLQVDEGRLPD